MISKLGIRVKNVVHVPASTYKGTDGQSRDRSEYWECLSSYADSAYSRALKKPVMVQVEAPLTSQVPLENGDYVATIQTAVVFGKLSVTIIAVEATTPTVPKPPSKV